MRKTMGMWRERITATSSGTSHTMYSESVSEGERWFLQRVSVRDDTTSGASCLVSIDAGTHVHPLHLFSGLTANVESDAEIQCWLRESERLQFAWSGVAANDKLYVHVTGHKQSAD